MFTLIGKQFHLAKIGLMRAACPVELHFTQHNTALTCPIIVVKNSAKLGTVEATNYTPKAVLVAGRRYREQLLDMGVVKTWAYVEAGAVDNMTEEIGCAGLMSKLRSMLQGRTLLASAPTVQIDQIVAVFPFENYFVHTANENKLKLQHYVIDPVLGSLTFLGSANITAAEAKQAMLPVQTGVRYAVAPPMGNTQSSTTGAPRSELVTQLIRDLSNIQQAVHAYLSYIKTRVNRSPMTPSFTPVPLTPDHKIATALVAAGVVDIYDFALWCAAQKELFAGGPGSGRHIGSGKFSKPSGSHSLSKDAKVHWNDNASSGFAQDYSNGMAGDHATGGPSAKNEKDAEAFYNTYDSKQVRSGFAGSGETHYQNKVNGEVYSVIKSPNGKGFYGTDHVVSRIGSAHK